MAVQFQFHYLLSLPSKVAIFFTFLCKIFLHFQCTFMGRLCFFITLCSLFQFHNRVFLTFLMDCASCLKPLLTKYTDFGCGFFIFGCFSKVFDVLMLFSTFILGFKVLQFSGHYKFRKGFFIDGTTRVLGDNNHGCSGDQEMEEFDEFVGSNHGFIKERDDYFMGNEEHDENLGAAQVFDVMTLRKMVKDERVRANAYRRELEKERMAASSAANEAMAMILRLQNEKSSLQMQINQLHRLVEEKKLYDQDVIHNLQWIISKHESERSLLQDQLWVCRDKLRVYVKNEEWDKFDHVCQSPSVSYASFGGNKFEDLPM